MAKFDDLPWEFFMKLGKQSKFKDKLPTKDALEYVLKEPNYPRVVKTVLKNLKKIDPERANLQNAANIADRMVTFARNLLSKK